MSDQLPNPYLEVFDKYMMKNPEDSWQTWIPRTSVELPVPRYSPERRRYWDEWLSSSMARDYLTERFAWAVPNTEAIVAIAELGRPVVEIGAGNGYWAWLLQQAGVDVIAYDTALTKRWNQWCECDHWVTVHRGGPTKAKDHPDRALFLCWPPYGRTMAQRSLELYTGDTLIYVGEGEGGCTANPEFFEILEDHWDITHEVLIPQWSGMHDYLWIYRRDDGDHP